jgi:manganese/zinc/iron transport system permease protein
MTPFDRDILLVATTTAVACALPGVFLVLRRMALMSDAISHVVLLGIVLAFFATRDLKSPLLVVGAALAGVAAVALVGVLERTRLVKEDAAIALVFPALFSAAVILVSLYLRDTHLDVDSVLLGILEFAPLRRARVAGWDAPYALLAMGGALVINVLFIGLFFKELKLSTFDAALAASLGFAPAVLHYALMMLVSLTAVTAFDAVGSVLVVALMIVPAATAYLLTDRLWVMLVLSAGLGVTGAAGGFFLARPLNANIAGSMAMVLGAQFGLALLFAPGRGLVAQARRRARQRQAFYETMLAIHLLNHEGTPEEAEESKLAGLHEHLRWRPAEVARVVRRAARDGLVEERGGRLVLTPAGRRTAGAALAQHA